jgi:hypothetical protein
VKVVISPVGVGYLPLRTFSTGVNISLGAGIERPGIHILSCHYANRFLVRADLPRLS